MKTMFGRAPFAQANREPKRKANGASANEASVCLRVGAYEGLIHLSRGELHSVTSRERYDPSGPRYSSRCYGIGLSVHQASVIFSVVTLAEGKVWSSRPAVGWPMVVGRG